MSHVMPHDESRTTGYVNLTFDRDYLIRVSGIPRPFHQCDNGAKEMAADERRLEPW
jgi:hypothetical protein